MFNYHPNTTMFGALFHGFSIKKNARSSGRTLPRRSLHVTCISLRAARRPLLRAFFVIFQPFFRAPSFYLFVFTHLLYAYFCAGIHSPYCGFSISPNGSCLRRCPRPTGPRAMWVRRAPQRAEPQAPTRIKGAARAGC